MSTTNRAWERGEMDPNREGQVDGERWMETETESRAWEIQGQVKEPEEQAKDRNKEKGRKGWVDERERQ